MFYLPSIGAAVSHPLSADDIWKSHVADGSTKEIIVIPTAVFKYIRPHIVRREKWNFPKPGKQKNNLELFQTFGLTNTM